MTTDAIVLFVCVVEVFITDNAGTWITIMFLLKIQNLYEFD